ncbi:type I methionyl aminopeptidase [Microlunatus sp. Gsoil 973]|uniref:type I methionyl aminopeptidase n=1 Tax=Microlunatus sp. Gsoil 973 TaxID=2672569 RepID=UPI001E53755F|nr:type I methionyl aminopeptidase [Microlunatus sp. Gsoil 973]
MFRRRRPQLETTDELLVMRRAGLVVARTLAALREEVTPGISTGELDQIADELIRAAGATPSFLGYGGDAGRGGFPGVICTSVNDEILHGIPGKRVLAPGDLISIDCGAVVDGWHGDAAITVPVDEPAADHRLLVETTGSALWSGIAAARLGGRIGDISAAVEDRIDALETEHGRPYGIVTEYVGHGIGSAMHQEPEVPNVGRSGRGVRIVRGLALAIEPMITLGSAENHTAGDGWTVVTDDGRPAAHWEHTITVTDRGTWVLTAEDGGEAALTALGVPFGPLAD